MGDRVLFQIVAKNRPNQFGPVVYCHWSGSLAPEIVRALAKRMEGRSDDMSYATARLVQECVGDDGGNLSFGVWNADKKLTAEDSHGDAGVVLIDCANGFRCECLGGYLYTGEDGFPVVPY